MDDFEACANRLKKYLDDLKEFEGSDLSGKKDYYAASMLAFSAINESLRAAELLMAEEAMPAPATYREMMDVLAGKQAISAHLAGRMKLLVTTRNMIAHEYGEIMPKDVSGFISKSGTLREFLAALMRRREGKRQKRNGKNGKK